MECYHTFSNTINIGLAKGWYFPLAFILTRGRCPSGQYIISATLFGFAINGIASCLPREILRVLYVYDFSISYASFHFDFAQRHIQGALAQIIP